MHEVFGETKELGNGKTWEPGLTTFVEYHPKRLTVYGKVQELQIAWIDLRSRLF